MLDERLQGGERRHCSELAKESAASEGELWIAEGAAPVALDGVGGAVGASE